MFKKYCITNNLGLLKILTQIYLLQNLIIFFEISLYFQRYKEWAIRDEEAGNLKFERVISLFD